MTVYVHRNRAKGFTMIPNTALRDTTLSLKAKGLLVQLLSHEDGWQQTIAYAQRECADGREAVANALTELETAGYVKREKHRTATGQWRWDHHIYDEPYTGNPFTEKPSIEEEALDEDSRKNLKTATASTNTANVQPTDRQLYFAGKMDLTVAQVVRLNQDFGTPAALSAMEQLHGFPPEGAVKNVYGYLRTVASFKKAGAA